jgi:type IV secretory pathway VirB2 component (pilin)
VVLATVMLRNSYVAAEAQLQKAQAQLAVSNGEYERLQTLHNENQNVSQKDFEAARGVMQTDRASLDAAQKALSIAASAVQQSWGGAVAGWVANDSPPLASVLNQQAMLVQLTLPIGTSPEAPPRITLSTPNGNTAQADYLSPFPHFQTAFTGTIATGLALVAIVVGGLMFAFGEGAAKRTLAGVIFGVGMAVGAVNFMSWLFP